MPKTTTPTFRPTAPSAWPSWWPRTCRSNLALASHLSRSAFAGKYAFDLPVVLQTAFRKDTFNITKYGAVADGQTLNTEAFRKAIDACSQQRRHGAGAPRPVAHGPH